MKQHRGFTLIELMIVIAIIGILASIAVSAYQTYTIRAQVTEGVYMASAAKGPIVDAYMNDGAAPPDRVAAGMSPDAADTSGAYVGSVDIVDGQVLIVFNGPEAHVDILGDTLYLTPYETSSNSITWRCGTAAAPAAGALLDGGADHDEGTIDERYLPFACRGE